MSTKYFISLTDEGLERLNLALIAACYYELKYLKYPKFAESRGNNPGVQAVKENLIRYMSLRRELLAAAGKPQCGQCVRANVEGMEPEVCDEEYWHIVDEWNREIKRLREEGSEYEKRDQCADD